MAHYLKLLRVVPVTLVLIAISDGATAQRLPDPTLPPAELGTVGAAVSTSPLQSVLISSGRKLAVINGQVVPLGGMYGDARLVRVAPTEVTLQNEQTTEVLKLYPGAEKAPTPRQRKSGQPEISQNRGE